MSSEAQLSPSAIGSSMKNLYACCNEGDGWERFKEKDGVLIFRKKGNADNAFHCFKGIGSVAVPAEVVVRCLFDKEQRPTFDPLCKNARVVREVDKYSRITAMEFQAKKCVVPVHRDTLTVEHVVKMTDGSYLFLGQSEGVPQDEVPPVPKSSRAFVYTSGWHIVPTQHGSSLTYVTQVDMKGLPTAILNIAAVSQPMLVRKLEMHLASAIADNLPPLPDINLACSECFTDVEPGNDFCPNCATPAPKPE